MCVRVYVCVHRIVELEVVIPEAEPICIKIVLLRHILERLACQKKKIRFVRTECANVRESVCMCVRESMCEKVCTYIPAHFPCTRFSRKRVYVCERDSMCKRICMCVHESECVFVCV